MSNKQSRVHSRVVRSAILLASVLAVVTTIVRAQTFTVLHTFSGGADGANPLAGLTMNAAGDFYGTTSLGGTGNGEVYKLSRHGSGWILNPLYQFGGLPDGSFPEARVTIAPDGTLYGSTFYGGIAGGGCAQGGPVQCGTVFHLTPPARACSTVLCPWTETQIYAFNSQPNLFWPNFGDLVFDNAANLYGVAFEGGHYSGGVFQLAPPTVAGRKLISTSSPKTDKESL